MRSRVVSWVRSHKAWSAVLLVGGSLAVLFLAYNAYWALTNRDAPDEFTLSEQPLDLEQLGLGSSTSTTTSELVQTTTALSGTTVVDGSTTTSVDGSEARPTSTSKGTASSVPNSGSAGPGARPVANASTAPPVTTPAPRATDPPARPVVTQPAPSAPPPTQPPAPVTAPPSATAAIDGNYNLVNPGVNDAGAGYRVLEDVPIGGPETVVGRTSQVSGSLTISNGAVTAASVTVDARSLSTGVGLRDETLRNQYLESNAFPTSTFVLQAPIALSGVPGDGQVVSVSAAGSLTMHGQTRAVTASIQARRTGPVIEVVGQIPVKLGNFGIQRPDALGRTVRDDATVEFKVYFAK